MDKNKILAQAELDQSMAGLRSKNLEDIRRLKDSLCKLPIETMSRRDQLIRICVRTLWLQLETQQSNIDEASYLENRSIMNMRKWFADPKRRRELLDDGGGTSKEILQLIDWDNLR